MMQLISEFILVKPVAIGATTLVVVGLGVVIGITLGKKKIKKGIKIYEDI